MKKYVKPELFYERYELSQHIADCGWELKDPEGNLTWGQGGACKAYPDSKKWGEGYTETLFTEGIGCTIDSRVSQDYCYQTGSGGMKVAVS